MNYFDYDDGFKGKKYKNGSGPFSGEKTPEYEEYTMNQQRKRLEKDREQAKTRYANEQNELIEKYEKANEQENIKEADRIREEFNALQNKPKEMGYEEIDPLKQDIREMNRELRIRFNSAGDRGYETRRIAKEKADKREKKQREAAIKRAQLRFDNKGLLYRIMHFAENPKKSSFDELSIEEIDRLYMGKDEKMIESKKSDFYAREGRHTHINDLIDDVHDRDVMPQQYVMYARAGKEMEEYEKKRKQAAQKFINTLIPAIGGTLATAALVGGTIATGGLAAPLGFALAMGACGTGAIAAVSTGIGATNLFKAIKNYNKAKAVKMSLQANSSLVSGDPEKIGKEMDRRYEKSIAYSKALYKKATGKEDPNLPKTNEDILRDMQRKGHIIESELSEEQRREVEEKTFEELLKEMNYATIYTANAIGRIKKRTHNFERDELAKGTGKWR